MSFSLPNSVAEDRHIKTKRLCIPFSITAHATPASKTLSTDAAGVLILSAEGLTATATAADSGTNFTTESDSDGIFGLLVTGLGIVTKVLEASVKGTAVSAINTMSTGTCAVTLKGASSTGVTASGNVAVSVDSNQDISSQSVSGILVLEVLCEV